MKNFWVVVLERVMDDGEMRTDFETIEANFGYEAVSAAVARLITNQTSHFKTIKWHYVNTDHVISVETLKGMKIIP